jgi:formate dehydrogenase major subunit
VPLRHHFEQTFHVRAAPEDAARRGRPTTRHRRLVGLGCGDQRAGGGGADVGVRTFLEGWPVYRQLTGTDPLGRGAAARSRRSETLTARTETADSVARSVCPYCAVGCGQKVYVKDGAVTQIEGDPDSPVSRGRLCPKGSASKDLVTSPLRQTTVRYRRPFGTQWEDLPLDTAMEMIADRVLKARTTGWQDVDDQGRALRRTLGVASLGGATLDNEENYLLKKLFTAMGAIQIENQARI